MLFIAMTGRKICCRNDENQKRYDNFFHDGLDVLLKILTSINEMKRFYLIIIPVMMRPDLMPNFRAEKNWSEFLKVQMPEI